MPAVGGIASLVNADAADVNRNKLIYNKKNP
jgi:hypothetical protein